MQQEASWAVQHHLVVHLDRRIAGSHLDQRYFWIKRIMGPSGSSGSADLLDPWNFWNGTSKIK
jgi:hypothetical protein